MYKLSSILSAILALIIVSMMVPAQAGTLTAMPVQWSSELSPFANRAKKLGSYDLVLLIDRSASMRRADCPRGENLSRKQSRWKWCCQETSYLADQTKSILQHGIRVVVFSVEQKIYDNVKVSNVADIFLANKPSGKTKIAPALEGQLEHYINRQSGRPLLIAIITDGCFENSLPIQKAINNAAKISTSINVVFLQIGQDQEATNSLQNLQAGFSPTVTYKPFSELKKTGLMQTLLEVVSADIAQK
ncbi:MAG: hypothetical protein K2W82_19780 [Candidatus Obscuribacterales bacterium]|nr:hypothetical protein [Candidatus Obscuribacterales bacterium]